MTSILEYKCPNCGGSIEFDSTLQKMKCPYCDTEFDVEALKEYDKELQNEQEDNLVWDTPTEGQWDDEEMNQMVVYICESCGGEIVADKSTAAANCPFCDTPVVMKGQLSGQLRPDYVIPFKLDKRAAKEGLRKHFNGKRLLPKVFKDENHIDEIKGIYVPFWLFDAEADVNMRFQGIKLRHWSDSDYNYNETRYYSVIRKGSLAFQRIPVDGSSKMEDDLMESIEPFDFSDAVDFQTAYLAGYLADKYDVTIEESIARANERVKNSAESTFSSTVKGYNSTTLENSNVQLHNGKAKYALYPVWILNTTWKGEKYTFAMNGQTGKFVGNLPMDKGIFWRWFTGISVISGAITYGLMWLLLL